MKKIILTLMFLLTIMVSFAKVNYEPMIREDRIWEYCLRVGDSSQSSKGVFKLKFDGTEDRNGKTYHRLVCWNAADENPIPKTVAYMREETLAVYCLLQQDEVKVYGNGFDLKFPVVENQEICLYQFGTVGYPEFEEVPHNVPAVTDIYGCAEFNAKLNILPLNAIFKVVHVNDADWNVSLFYGEDKTYLMDEWLDGNPENDMAGITVVEGVGNVGRGFLHTPSYLGIPIGMAFSNVFFLRQTDLYGNTVFDAKWLKDQSGVTDIVPQERPKDGKSYDLTGKQVNDPEPGTIYIQDGEKRIAR